MLLLFPACRKLLSWGHAVFQSLFLIMTILLSISAGHTASADELKIPIFIDQADLTADAVEEIAKVAEPTTISFSAGETLDEIVKRACGREDALYLDYIKRNRPPALASALPEGDVGGSSKVKMDGSGKFPFCLKLPSESRVTLVPEKPLRRGDNGEDIKFLQSILKGRGYDVAVNGEYEKQTEKAVRSYQRQTGIKIDGVAGKETWTSFSHPPSGSAIGGYADMYPYMLSKSPNSASWSVTYASDPVLTGGTLTSSYQTEPDWSAGWMGINPESGEPKIISGDGPPAPSGLRQQMTVEHSGLTSIPVRQGLLPEDADKARTALVAMIGPNAAIEKPSPDTYELISDLADADAPECNSETSEDHPIPLVELMKIIGLNTEKISRDQMAAATILVADSGVYGIGQAPFQDRFFKWASVSGRDPDIAWQPLPSYAKSMHGTYVTSAALGSSHLRPLLQLLDPPVRVIARNIVAPSNLRISTDSIGSALNVYGADILNLSFAGTQASDTLRSFVAQKTNQLFVVAAGNNREALTNSYPALLGGEKNVITVGALDNRGMLASFSNHSRKHVAIAAPGCRVPVYSFLTPPGDGSVGAFKAYNASGTSLAAPLVSFTAALLRRYQGWPPQLIKNRLLASADVVDSFRLGGADENAKKTLLELPQKVEDGRVLNAPNAVAIFNDVLTLTSHGPPILGEVKGLQDKVAFCEGKEPIDRKKLRRLVTHFINEEGDERVLIYYDDAEYRLQSETCKASSLKELTFEFVEEGAQRGETVSTREVRSLIFKPL